MYQGLGLATAPVRTPPAETLAGHCQGKSLSAAACSPAQILAGGTGQLTKVLEGGRCCWLRLALEGVGLMRGKLRASPSFADMSNTSLCPPGFHLWPQSPFTPYSQAPWGPLDLMGATVQPHLVQGGRPLSGHSVGIRGWSLIQETGTLLHHPKTLWAQQALQSVGGHK